MADAATPRAFLRVGGVTVARQQLGLALDLKCERIICLAHGMRPELVDLQHEAEANGAQFHIVPGARALLGLVTAVDTLFVFGDGLFVSNDEAATLLETGEGVFVQPIEQGLAAGFERIDLNNASAAAMRIPGRLVEAVADLPADCDAASALQRVALQSGLRQRPIPPVDNGSVFWSLVRSDADAHALEPQWIRQRTSDDRPLSPSRVIALGFVRKLGPGLIHAGSGSTHLGIGAVMLMLLAAVAGWFGFFVAGLILAAFASISGEVAGLLGRVEAQSIYRQTRLIKADRGFGWMIDALLIGLAGFGTASQHGQTDWDRLFPPFMLIALLRILPQVIDRRWAASLGDRGLLALGLASALAGGVGSVAVHAGAVVAAIAGIVLPRVTKRLTRP
ncbi:hypothetical protein ACFFF7_07380 [Novosphingobium aquiterrae]|uniref:CDP-alcohol phosphatidyltransferase family protein n=1 Tax=Novosphingobium aquiterrae TaxID=624388 RepID=A0ABV6PHB5_9SPHN